MRFAEIDDNDAVTVVNEKLNETGKTAKSKNIDFNKLTEK